jgi:hypothetical protein
LAGKRNNNLMIGILLFLVLASVYYFNFYKKEATYIPSGPGQSYYNPYFYLNATDQPPQDCQSQPSVNFRTTNLNYNFGAIAYNASGACGSSLTAYGYSGYTTLVCPSTSMTQIGTLPNNHILCKRNSEPITTNLYISRDSGSSNVFNSQDPDRNLVSTSISSLDNTTEIICGIVPTQDSGKYMCYNNDVYVRYCNQYSSQDHIVSENGLSGSCSQSLACQYSTNTQINGQVYPTVKCGGTYQKNKDWCEGQYLYHTTSQGELNPALGTLCGYTCSNNQCVNCLSGNKSCSGSGIPQQCDVNGNWVNLTPCGPAESCLNGVCSSNYTENQKRCVGKQRQIYHSATGWTNNGAECLYGCGGTNYECTDECQLNNCQESTNRLYTCLSNEDLGNTLQLLGNCLQQSTPHCKDATSCSPLYTLSEEYCDSNNRMIAVIDNTNLLAGQVKLQLIPPACTEGHACVKDGVTKLTSCYQPPSDCVGNNNFCHLGDVYSCNNGQIGTKQTECYMDACTDNPARCTDLCNSTDQKTCQYGNVWKCYYNTSTQQRYLVFDTDCGSYGCSGGVCNGLSYCTGHANDWVCETNSPTRCHCSGDMRSCTETEPCANGCENNACIQLQAECSGAFGCKNNKLYTCNNGTFTATVFFDCQNKGCDVNSQDVPYPGNSYCHSECSGDTFCGTGSDMNKVFSCLPHEYYSNHIQYIKSLTPSTTCGYKCQNNGQYCDDLAVTLSTSAFAPGTVTLRYLVKGSDSGFLADLPTNAATVTTTGPGVSLTSTYDSGVEGIMNVDLGNIGLGTYTSTVSVPAYSFSQSYSVIITSQYIISIPAGKETVFQIPNVPTVVNLQLTPSNVSSGVSISTSSPPVPTGLVIENIEADSAGQGKFNMKISGTTGSYDFKLKTSSGDNEYQLHVDYKKPQLFVAANLGTTAKLEKKSYTLDVTGHSNSAGDIKNMDSDSNPVVKVNGNAVTVSKFGGGRYNFDYTYSEEGEYNFIIDASKSGYEDGKKTYTVIASKSGNVNPTETPSGNESVTTSCKMWETYNGTSCNFNYILLVIVLVLAFFAYKYFAKKKRRK